MTAILVYTLSSIMFACHRGVYKSYMVVTVYQNLKSAPIMWTIILIFGFLKWRPSWILPQCNIQSTFKLLHCVGHTRKPYGRHQQYAFASILSRMMSIYSLTLQKWRPS